MALGCEDNREVFRSLEDGFQGRNSSDQRRKAESEAKKICLESCTHIDWCRESYEPIVDHTYIGVFFGKTVKEILQDKDDRK